jgi:hypothetical protein
VKRTQIYLETEQAERLDRRAAARGTTRSELIREAIDGYMERPLGQQEWRARWSAAVRETAGIAPDLSPDDVEEMRAAGPRRLTELERRGRG